jgi:glutamine amidotransferase
MAGFIEALGAAAGIAEPLQMTVGVSDGEHLYAARYASGPVVNTLYYSADLDSLRELYPADERLAHFAADARAVVSEPLAELPGLWHEVPVGSAIVVEKGRVDQFPFRPRLPD